jgi:hypothetical protein
LSLLSRESCLKKEGRKPWLKGSDVGSLNMRIPMVF